MLWDGTQLRLQLDSNCHATSSSHTLLSLSDFYLCHFIGMAFPIRENTLNLILPLSVIPDRGRRVVSQASHPSSQHASIISKRGPCGYP